MADYIGLTNTAHTEAKKAKKAKKAKTVDTSTKVKTTVNAKPKRSAKKIKSK